MNQSRAIIVVENRPALRVAASSARISTRQGTAMEIFENSQGDERDLKLIDKVLASGHKSVIEHQTFSVAFDDVSVLVEQFVIEARLASFTVKSRRYVDFSNAGYVVPLNLSEQQRALYDAPMRARFSDYEKLMELGVPKEDARFVLPYCLRSNFYMTVNARELISLIGAMLFGRGKQYPELVALGGQLKRQFDKIYPGVIDAEQSRCADCAVAALPNEVHKGSDRTGSADLLSAPPDPDALLARAMMFTGRFKNGTDLCSLVLDARPRELELLNYTFIVRDVSLASVTHFTRHRIQSLIVPRPVTALKKNAYVLPETVRMNPEALQCYTEAFRLNAEAAGEFAHQPEIISYFALAGNTVDILFGMNARELIHFLRLRTCTRAQWEIRACSNEMLSQLMEEYRDLFRYYGPSCAVLGYCPEGRLSCGKLRRLEEDLHG